MSFVVAAVAVAISFGALVRSLGWGAVAPVVSPSVVVYAFSGQGRRSDRSIHQRRSHER